MDADHTAPAATSGADVHLDRVLQLMAGPTAVARDDQRAAVRALVNDRSRVLVVQATGWGKSAVYWAATAALRAAGSGPTLVISPLLALMRDQVSAATKAGLTAATVNSTNPDDWDHIFESAIAQRLDVLLVSPERLANPRFGAILPQLIGAAGLVVIDEAHCISDWGFDFRPDYQRLAKSLVGVASGTPVLATTATANTRVTLDVAAQLGSDTKTFRGSLARSSLTLSVVPGLPAIERYAWVCEAISNIDGSGIVYALTISETEQIAGFLSSQGFAVAAYSGALEPSVRERIEDQLRANELKAVVATSALGMGYDKPDLAFCIHVGSPSSPVAYYQQVGRAGRALNNAQAILLPAETDDQIWNHFATVGVPDRTRVGLILDALANGPQTVLALETTTAIRRGRLEGLLKILAVEDVVVREGTSWRTTGNTWTYDAARWDALAEVRANEADLMRRYAGAKSCLMRTLQTALDDPDPQDCGRCSVCTNVLPAPGPGASVETLEFARAFVRGRDVVLEPRKMWPSGVGRKGKITGADRGRALAFADDPGWVNELRDLTASPASPVSDEVAAGMVSVLGRWRTSWGQRPVAIVPLQSIGHGRLTRSIAEHLATVGKLPLIDAIHIDGHMPNPDVPSVKQVEARLRGMKLKEGVDIPRGPILVVDTLYQTGWTMTVAAALLREAGATNVLPLVLHQLP
jgi:ATP-dependent DNA helicase RecQ